jgi:hypothetical protein
VRAHGGSNWAVFGGYGTSDRGYINWCCHQGKLKIVERVAE